jgi:hypothetical protein
MFERHELAGSVFVVLIVPPAAVVFVVVVAPIIRDIV